MSEPKPLKAFCVEYTGFDESICYVAAKTRGSARFAVASSMAENYYGDMRRMNVCLSHIKSVRRHPKFDALIDQRRDYPRFITDKSGLPQ